MTDLKHLSNSLLFCFVVQLAIKGYNHKQPVLLKKILERITNFQVDPKRFSVFKERVSAKGHTAILQEVSTIFMTARGTFNPEVWVRVPLRGRVVPSWVKITEG